MQSNKISTGAVFAVALAALALAGCQKPATPAPEAVAPTTPQSAAQPATGATQLDPFVVMVDAERWGVIIDRAMDGVRDAPDADPSLSENDLLRSDVAVKTGAAELLRLRNRICAKGLLAGDACVIRDWPAWASEPPSAATPIEEIERRSAWLGEAMSVFTDIGCAAGRNATKDEMFCSVE